jgi:hypothetical protein
VSRYRKIDVRMWGDSRFRKLSRPAPNGQTLWLYLLTGPQTGIIPGLYSAREGGIADALGWSLEGFRKAFREVSGEAMPKALAEADWEAGLVFLPQAIVHNPPQSPNVVRSWSAEWDVLPECPLKLKAYRRLATYFGGLGEGFRKAFGEAIADPLANQEQEQEQEQDGERDARLHAHPRTQASPQTPQDTPSRSQSREKTPPSHERPIEPPDIVPNALEALEPVSRVRRAYESRFLALRGAPPAWTAKNVESCKLLSAWVETYGGNAESVIRKLMDGFFADAWAQSTGFPLAALANDPARYLAPPRKPRDVKRGYVEAADASAFTGPEVDPEELFGLRREERSHG